MYSIVMSVIIDLKVEFDMFLIVIGVRFSLIIVIIVLVMMGGISVLIQCVLIVCISVLSVMYMMLYVMILLSVIGMFGFGLLLLQFVIVIMRLMNVKFELRQFGMWLLISMKNSSVLMFDMKMYRFGLKFISSGVSMVELNIVMMCCMFIVIICGYVRCLLGLIMCEFVLVGWICQCGKQELDMGKVFLLVVGCWLLGMCWFGIWCEFMEWKWGW